MLSIGVINKSPFPLPQYQTASSAGMDVRAHLEVPVTLAPFERIAIPTGLFLEIPEGYEVQVRPRSGLALHKGISIPNAPGTIDPDYRGELKVILINLSGTPQTIEPGERVAQLVVAAFEQAIWKPEETLSETVRGSGGFGHTGNL